MRQAEVVVYGATSAGVCAAVAAARRGLDTVLLEPGRHVGGMTSGGLGYTDIGDPRVLGGMAAEFRRAVADAYGAAPGHYAGPEPHVAEGIFVSWLERAGVEVVYGAPLRTVVTSGERIFSVVTHQGDYTAGAFVDASYEGDLMAAAGVSYRVGREDRALHGETFAGRREIVPGMHNFPPWISPFRADGTLLPQVADGPMAEVGAGDGGVMSYGYRVCLTSAADRIPIERRPGYDEEHWELGRRLFRHWREQGVEPRAGRLVGLEPNLPGGKCDGNSLGPFSLSVLDRSAWDYPDAGPDERERIRLHHLHHAQDLLYFLSHDPEVPASVRAELGRWGLPPDEFADTGHLPHQLYVREARRMLGDGHLTEHDLVQGRPQADAIAMGSYHLDVREVQRTWRQVYEHPDPVPMVVTEGYLSVGVAPYQIPYAAIVPRRAECGNLVVPVCLSASHVAFSSIRMEVQYQMLGHAAGLAAAQAAGSGKAVQDIDVAALQDGLSAAGQVLSL
ncbi:FAD-dependent oxidoreductase [Nonomuraea diastatica]|uniref:FAD-dependent oxidoreductase n=1 Tax=Nonomuraea diastatica TaxID=1848329 RepID=A0A4R4W820_9ACTN|nr:FAD-dependent oxidoreductase [Nonomuraea diastatica]TDD13177.1 FAD-dependent oxidoreductase [Nonomuraea diastatica]